MHYKLNSFIFVFLLLFSLKGFGQNDIKPMLCEGEMPAEFLLNAKEISKNKSSEEFTKRNLIGIQELFANGYIVYGNATHNYLKQIGNEIIEKNNISENIKFFLIRSNDYNAFATDEGYIVVTTALMAQVKNAAELTFILGHEISHILLQHNTEQYENVLKILKGNEVVEEQGKSREVKSLEEKISEIYKYSRSKEFEADSLGFLLFTKVGYGKIDALNALSALKNDYPILERYNPNPSFYFKDKLTLYDQIFRDSMGKSFDKKMPITRKMFEKDSSERAERHAVSRYYDSLHKEFIKNNPEFNKNINSGVVQDSIDNSTHPLIIDRVNRLRDFSNDNPIANSEIPINVRSQCLQEFIITLTQQGDYIEAIAMLPILDSLDASLTSVEAWKGIVLANYLTFYTIDRGQFSVQIDLQEEQIHLQHYEFSIYGRIYQNLLAIVWLYNKRATPHYFQAVNLYNENLYQRTFMEVADSLDFVNADINNDYNSIFIIDTVKSDVWKPQSYSENKFIPSTFNMPSDKVNNPVIFKRAPTHKVAFSMPQFGIVNTKYTKKYNRRAGDLLSIKLAFTEELKYQAKRQHIEYAELNYFDKTELSTQNYNNLYKSNAIFQNLLNKRGYNICPITMPFAKDLKGETGCDYSQFVYIFHVQRKPLIRPASVIKEALYMYAVPFTFHDFSTILAGKSITTVAVNFIIDYNNLNITHLGQFGNGFTLKYGNLSAIANWIQYDTKNKLLH